MLRTTRPNAAKPCPSGFRRPPKSSSGWFFNAEEEDPGAVSDHPAPWDTVLSRWREPGVTGPLQRDGAKNRWSGPAMPGPGSSKDLDRIGRLVGGSDGSEEPAVRVQAGAGIAQKIQGRSSVRPGIEFESSPAGRPYQHPGNLRQAPRQTTKCRGFRGSLSTRCARSARDVPEGFRKMRHAPSPKTSVQSAASAGIVLPRAWRAC